MTEAQNPGYNDERMIDMYIPTYNDLIKTTIENGTKVESRFGSTHEVIGQQVSFPAGLLVARRRMNYSIGWMELLQLLAGEYDACSIERVAPRANLPLFTLSMAYGPRIAPQMPRILGALKENPLSRQAIVFVGNEDDGPTSNQPCTTSVQFLVRDEKVHTVVSMRSWDLVKGLPYDVFMFGGLGLVVSHILNRENGWVYVRAASAHVYDADQHLAHAGGRRSRFKLNFFVPSDWDGVRDWAKKQVGSLQPGVVPLGIDFESYKV